VTGMISRRGFLAGGIVLGGALMVDSFVVEPRKIKVEDVTIGIEGLGPELDGFTICQVTDVHHGVFVGRSYVDEVVDRVRAMAPDLVALTGDYIDDGRSYMVPVIERLATLEGRYGTLAVLGNHDYFIEWRYSADVIRSHGIRLLTNEHVVIEKGGARLCVGGTRDYFEDVPDVRKTFEGAPAGAPRVLLCHHPDYAEFLPPDVRVDLMLSGHTHGGQIRVPFTGYAPVVPSHFGQKYAGGLVTLPARGPEGMPPTRVYVSRGVGMALIPVRFNCPPELTLLRLRSV